MTCHLFDTLMLPKPMLNYRHYIGNNSDLWNGIITIFAHAATQVLWTYVLNTIDSKYIAVKYSMILKTIRKEESQHFVQTANSQWELSRKSTALYRERTVWNQTAWFFSPKLEHDNSYWNAAWVGHQYMIIRGSRDDLFAVCRNNPSIMQYYPVKLVYLPLIGRQSDGQSTVMSFGPCHRWFLLLQLNSNLHYVLL